KKLVGGGEITIVNKTVPLGLEKLGYAPDEVDEVVAFIDERNTVVGAPYVKTEHYPVFDCPIGDRAIHSRAHVKMVARVPPVLSGDGTPGDIFVDIAKDGTTMAGLMNSLMIAVSMGLQYGVPPEVYVSKLSHLRFEPSGLTNDADIRNAKSIVDYIFRWFGKKFLTPEQQEEVGILTPEVKARLAASYATSVDDIVAELPEAPPKGQTALFNAHEDAIECSRCGGRMVRAGTCYTCRDCGTSTGCG